jgi:hypothetical protein
VKWLDHFVVKKDQVLVLRLVESRILHIANQVVRYLMPHPVDRLPKGALTSLCIKD